MAVASLAQSRESHGISAGFLQESPVEVPIGRRAIGFADARIGRTVPARRTIRFGRYCLHPTQGLKRGRQEVRITPKSLSVLRALVERSEEVVTKDELFRTVWADTAVSDAALTSCIQELRHALQDDARAPRFIETVHRRGFRFLVPCSADGHANGDRQIATPPARPVGSIVGRDAALGAAVPRVGARPDGHETDRLPDGRARNRKDGARRGLSLPHRRPERMAHRASRLRRAVRSRRGVPAVARGADPTLPAGGRRALHRAAAPLRAHVAGAAARVPDPRGILGVAATQRRGDSRSDASRADRRARGHERARADCALPGGPSLERCVHARLDRVVCAAAGERRRSPHRHVPSRRDGERRALTRVDRRRPPRQGALHRDSADAARRTGRDRIPSRALSRRAGRRRVRSSGSRGSSTSTPKAIPSSS